MRLSTVRDIRDDLIPTMREMVTSGYAANDLIGAASMFLTGLIKSLEEDLDESTTTTIPGEINLGYRIPCDPDAAGAVGDYRPIEERRREKR